MFIPSTKTTMTLTVCCGVLLSEDAYPLTRPSLLPSAPFFPLLCSKMHVLRTLSKHLIFAMAPTVSKRFHLFPLFPRHRPAW